MKAKPKPGMKLHKVIALGGKPSDFKKLNNKPSVKKK